jgi:hypothetical protein
MSWKYEVTFRENVSYYQEQTVRFESHEELTLEELHDQGAAHIQEQRWEKSEASIEPLQTRWSELAPTPIDTNPN